ncbi:sensor histidine kinase [Qipengyuania psychrotolerans]|uniref:sensor histidine kinase n=1 Tax=Qipengyuania psychrotolerans TaxID=2867238 RepID=UPI001FFC33D5|nr:HWE histidine kinase domain-containing protein [Qipengyuania psychrotolerans]
MPDLELFENRSADHLRLVLETSQIGIWELDLQTGLAVRNLTHDRIFGYDAPLDEWSYEKFIDHVIETDRARVDALQKTAIAENREWSFECQIRTAQGNIRWILAAGRPLQNSDGTTGKLIGQVIDITRSKQNEARLTLITEELNHRVRNILAMIQSMVKMSARGAKDIPAFARALEGRVGALARSHQLLVGDSPTSMAPSAILETELSAFAGIQDQIDLNIVDEAALSASASQGLGLVFHELLTNAMKHGALSNPAGRVEVTVSRSAKSVNILWKESGGPPVDQGGGSGFGSKLISKALAPDGTTELIFSPEGLECRIVLDAD